MSDVYLLMDERAMDPDQFGDAIVYSVAESLEAARRDQTESGCGVIIRASPHGDVLRWEEYIPAGRAAVAAPATRDGRRRGGAA